MVQIEMFNENSGAIYVFGGVLQSLASIMEWILGNTFSSTVFAFFG